MTKRPIKSQSNRTPIPASVAIEVLTEAGYRCAVPTCRGIVVLDLHHIVPVRDGGQNELENLIALCPTCHALYERRKINPSSIRIWKAFLQSLYRAYDHRTLDLLWFLKKVPNFQCSGDGVVSFASLVGAGLAELEISQQGFTALVGVRLSEAGSRLLDAWSSADEAFLTVPREPTR